MELTGAQILVQTLIEQGVDTVFGYPGGSVLGIFDAFGARAAQIRMILPAHEQGGAFAADGFCRAGGKAGVVLATSGPGATNLVTGLAAAYMDSSPLIALTGNVPRDMIGRDSFQEIDICGVTTPITKHNFMVQDVGELAQTVKDAFTIAHSGRPGPVLIDFPRDVAADKTAYHSVGRFAPRVSAMPTDRQLAQAAQMLGKSERPLLLAGGGVVNTGAAGMFARLAERTELPVVTSLMGLTALPYDHRLMLGMTGMHGTPASRYAATNCDLLICVGTRFSDRVAGDRARFAPHARIIHIDIDPSEFDKNVICDLSLSGDAKAILEALTACVPAGGHPAWLADVLAFRAAHPLPVPLAGDALHPAHLLHAIYEAAGQDAVIVTDVGQHQMWTAQYYPFQKPRSFITSGGLGAMGFGLGAAIGVKSVFPEKPVVLVTGDGSFHMNLPELSTAVTENLPVVTVIMNNGTLGMVRQWQRMFYHSRFTATSPERKTDFAAVCRAFGGLGFRAQTMPQAVSALRDAFDCGQTCVVDCAIDPDVMVFPTVSDDVYEVDSLYGMNGGGGGS